ncbi:MAG: Spy/CpxP family protein refolding chaperone, partial [Acidobacteria bacterium]|nr:Spy/CpxP family protein refolding chaperone [Acidobacteriota bacterium]
MFRVVLAPICALFLAGLAQAQEPPKPPAPGDAVKKILDLTDQQVQQLKDLRQSNGEKVRGLMTQMRDLEKQRRDLLQSSNPDPAQVGALVLQLRSLQQQVQAAQKSYHDAALGVLTETQKQKVTQIQEALKLVRQAGPLAAFGLLEGPGPGAGGPGPGGMMMRRFR